MTDTNTDVTESENQDTDYSYAWIVPAQIGGIGLIIGGFYLFIHQLGVDLMARLVEPTKAFPVILVLAGFILLFQGHKGEMLAARRGDEWWIDDD